MYGHIRSHPAVCHMAKEVGQKRNFQFNFLFIYYKGPSWKPVWIVCGSVTWLMKCEGRGCEGRVYTGDLFSQHDTADGRMEVAKGCLEVKALWGGVLPEQTVGGVAQARILGIVHSVLARKS